MQLSYLLGQGSSSIAAPIAVTAGSLAKHRSRGSNRSPLNPVPGLLSL